MSDGSGWQARSSLVFVEVNPQAVAGGTGILVSAAVWLNNGSNAISCLSPAKARPYEQRLAKCFRRRLTKEEKSWHPTSQ
ncbi:hypothetical protein LJR234_002685 [Mesorhizobium amorphae]|uniref:hypothetical protein n=1 Tax=Mesorhizobium amorphae TaxID=71433 RepID=UPI003ECC472D